MQRIGFKSLLQAWCSAQSVCLFLFFAYLVGLAIRVFQLDSNNLASWVQAIGSIVSIWAAWWIASQQSKKSEAESKGKDLAKCHAIIGLLEHVLRAVKHEPRTGQSRIVGQEVRAGIEKLLAMLDRVDVLTVPNSTFVNAVFETRYAVEMLDLKVKDYLQDHRVYIGDIHYDISMSLPCIRVVEEQTRLCREAASSYV